MSIANLRTKLAEVAQSGSENNNSIVRKFEKIGSINLKTTPTIIARDLTIDGNLNSSGIIEIEGNIKGTINGNSVVLREESFVEGLIVSEFLDIRGRFEGSIKAKHIHISAKARVHGEIEYNSLSVEDGAYVDGQFNHLKASS